MLASKAEVRMEFPCATRTAEDNNRMISRTRREVVTFRRPFYLETVGRPLPAGQYEVVTEEELIEGVSFPAYRRIATLIVVPSEGSRSVEMQNIDPRELAVALDCDAIDDPVVGPTLPK